MKEYYESNIPPEDQHNIFCLDLAEAFSVAKKTFSIR